MTTDDITDPIEEGHAADCYTGGDHPCGDCDYYWRTGG